MRERTARFWYLVSNGKAVTVTVGRQEDKEEDTVAAVAVGQIPAAQQLLQHNAGWCKGQRGHTREREGITDGLENMRQQEEPTKTTKAPSNLYVNLLYINISISSRKKTLWFYQSKGTRDLFLYKMYN